jgi:AcrR family transcriptional regulator
MDNKEEFYVDAAIRVFMRYGVRRTSMNDIATEAGIARQTLYKTFSNKDEVLCAAIRHVSEKAVIAAQQDCQGLDDLGAKMDAVFRHVVIQPYEIISAFPDAEDIVSGFNAAGKVEWAAANDRNRRLYEWVLAPYATGFEIANLSVSQVADVVQRSASAFKHDAKDKQELVGLLNSLKVMILKIAGA